MHKDHLITIPFTQLEEPNWKVQQGCKERQQKYDQDVRNAKHTGTSFSPARHY